MLNVFYPCFLVGLVYDGRHGISFLTLRSCMFFELFNYYTLFLSYCQVR